MKISLRGVACALPYIADPCAWLYASSTPRAIRRPKEVQAQRTQFLASPKESKKSTQREQGGRVHQGGDIATTPPVQSSAWRIRPGCSRTAPCSNAGY
jgi:hypothetical protein